MSKSREEIQKEAFKQEGKEEAKQSKKEQEEERFSKVVGTYSVCGVCQGAFRGGEAPVEESKEEFEGKKLYSAVHPECKGGPQVIYILKREQKKDEPPLVDSKQIVEIQVKYTDSAVKKREKDQE